MNFLVLASSTTALLPRYGFSGFSQRAALRHRMAASGVEESSILEALPYLTEESLLAENIRYTGFGQAFEGRCAYIAASRAWADQLPERLKAFNITECTGIIQPRRIVARYAVSFSAPVPLQVLPAQRSRLAAAKLERSADGRVQVRAIVAVNLRLDGEGRVVEHTESLAADPFAVSTTISNFEMLLARRLALEVPSGQPASPLALARAYWGSLRELTRRELGEAVRRSRSDEESVLAGADEGVTDAEFDAWFVRFVARNFLIGAALPASFYAVAKVMAALSH